MAKEKARKKVKPKKPSVVLEDFGDVTKQPEVKAKPKSKVSKGVKLGQCANCLAMAPIGLLFKCSHCGKTGCPNCGWDPRTMSKCHNCCTPVAK